MTLETYRDRLVSSKPLGAVPWDHTLRGISHAAFIERLCSERARYEPHSLVSTPTRCRLVVMCGPNEVAMALETIDHWQLQSSPNVEALIVVQDTTEIDRIRAAMSGALDISIAFWSADRDLPNFAGYSVFVFAGAIVHPSLTMSIDGLREPADVVVWGYQVHENGGWSFFKNAAYEPFTLLHHLYPTQCMASRDTPVSAATLSRAITDRSLFAILAPTLYEPELRVASLPHTLSVLHDRTTCTPDGEPDYATQTDRLRKTLGIACDRLGEGWRLKPIQTPRAISVIIPYRDKAETTWRCVRSVLAQESVSEIEIVLVNNQSSGASVRELENLIHDIPSGRVSITRVDYDAPFNHSAQCNLGIEAAHGDVMLLLNNDAYFAGTNTLSEMAGWAALDWVGTVGVRIVDASGALVGAGIKLRLNPGPYWNSMVEESRSPFLATSRHEVFGNSFACAALSRRTYERVGPFNAFEFPNGYNDVEYSFRLREEGRRNIYLGDHAVVHTPGTSRGKSDESFQKTTLRHRYGAMSNQALVQLDRDTCLPPPQKR
jgi:GT2 family glycosyltransferase